MVCRQAFSGTGIYGDTLTSSPLVSVILTVYNHARYVRESLDSVINTTYGRLELIVINDASQDETDAIIRQWIREHLSQLDPHAHVRIVAHVRPVSADLASLFRSGQETRTPLANDTSFGVGYAPLDALEAAVLAVATQLNSPETRAAHPSIGEDIKVMGARDGSEMELTVACALVGRHVANLADYAVKKHRIRTFAFDAARTVTDTPLHIAVNAAVRGM